MQERAETIMAKQSCADSLEYDVAKSALGQWMRAVNSVRVCYVCTDVCTYVSVCIREYVCVFMYGYQVPKCALRQWMRAVNSVRECIFMCVDVWVDVWMYVCIHAYECMCVLVDAYMHGCMYTNEKSSRSSDMSSCLHIYVPTHTELTEHVCR